MAYLARVVDNAEIKSGLERGLAEFRMSRVGCDELVDKSAIGRLGKEALLVQQRQNTHRLLNQIDSRLQIETEIDVFPLETLALVLLLLQNEHGMVEQLLQFLVRIVNAQLLERVKLETKMPTY